MNSLERVLAALQNRSSDRPALLLNAGLYGARLTGAALKDHYRDPEVFAEGQIAVREAFQPDLLVSPFALAGLGAAFGSRLSESSRRPPNVAAFAADSAEAALRLPLPDVDSHPQVGYLRDSIRILAKRYAGEVPVIGLLASPLDLPPLIIGLEAWFDALLFQPETARALLDHLTPFFVALGRAMLHDGATALALTANLANRSILPAPVVERLGRPSLEQALAEIPGPVILHHGGCPLLPHLADFKGLPNTVGYVVDAGEDLAAARAALGPGPLLLGNLPGPTLGDLSPEDIGALCDRALSRRAADLQFILATCGADIPLDTPADRLEAIADRVHRAGRVEA
ncbi:uroporphyrinogen decarboxylase family protein [Geothrix fermentans]|uniref:uroporphyrinogen decarboxylase family protein n=1 Tax=Geothrix fermentans TaxID=44676 RepID=UPI0004094615|nr:uroporphyrinogen decarboxylase family protein [Geothrix fermentans]